MIDAQLSEKRNKFNEALEKTYAGCVFDIDGTLTVRGDEYIPAFMHEILGRLSLSVPMATCSARSLEHAYEKMAPVFTKSPNPPLCQSNWVLICENGSIGFRFNAATKQYEEFYRVTYPYSPEHRETLYAKIRSAMGNKLGVSYMNRVSLVFRPVDALDPDREAVAARSAELSKICSEQLFYMDPKKLLTVGDSGLGVNVFPAAGNKERGTLEFAKYLAEEKGISIDPNARELVVVGDQPQPGGNDETFLNGKFGTPFTVGDAHANSLYPLPVFDSRSDKIMRGPEATTYLLQHLKFKTL
jgi:hydroxymethylpyrimidine pyrophosphatase-like HAD family hydrolase